MAKGNSGNVTHGMWGTSELKAWWSMRQRCGNPKAKGYERYGGRGIKVCKRWEESFDAFYRDMGDKPSQKHSLDRYPNNDGDYEPGNCRWATPAEQQANRSNTIRITHEGVTKSLVEWADYLGIPGHVIRCRIVRLGAGDAKVLLAPPYCGRMITMNGKTQNIKEWCHELNVNYKNVRQRLTRGWNIERAFSEPMRDYPRG